MVTHRGKRAAAGRSRRPLVLIGIALSIVGTVAVGLVGLLVHEKLSPTRLAASAADLSAAGLSATQLVFEAKDGVDLAGWWIPPRNGSVIIFSHGGGWRGHPANRAELLPLARELVSAGYGALLYDMRGFGESAGKSAPGRVDGFDVEAAANVACSRGAHRIAAFGFSRGAQVTLRGASASPMVAAIALDGIGNADINDETAPTWSARSLVFPLIWLGYEMMDVSAGPALKPSLQQLMSEFRRPAMFVGVGEDGVRTRQFYQLAAGAKSLWVIPKGQHGDAWKLHSASYGERLRRFFDEHLKSAPDAQQSCAHR